MHVLYIKVAHNDFSLCSYNIIMHCYVHLSFQELMVPIDLYGSG